MFPCFIGSAMFSSHFLIGPHHIPKPKSQPHPHMSSDRSWFPSPTPSRILESLHKPNYFHCPKMRVSLNYPYFHRIFHIFHEKFIHRATPMTIENLAARQIRTKRPGLRLRYRSPRWTAKRGASWIRSWIISVVWNCRVNEKSLRCG